MSKKLDRIAILWDNVPVMEKLDLKPTHKASSAMQLALSKVRQAPGTLFKARDIEGTTLTAASKALARLAAKGIVIRQAKGLYYAPKDTLVGRSRPSELAVLQTQLANRTRPTGTTAANLLGLSTQVPARAEIAVYATAIPRAAQAARIKLRRAPTGLRPLAISLSETDVALLEFLRGHGNASELNATDTLERLREILLGKDSPTPLDRLMCLAQATLEEPPRVRAMLGALLHWCGLPGSLYHPLKVSLNPLTRFDFGLLSALPNAKEWQSK